MDFTEEKFQEQLKEIVTASEDDVNRPLTLPELKELAQSMGLSDKEWENLLASADKSLTLAKSHLSSRNYVDAVVEADKATAINPYLKDGNSVLAKSYLMQWLDDNDPIKIEKAEFYARKELKNDPNDEQALSVLSTVQNKKRISNNDNALKKKILIGIGAFVLVLLIFYMRSPSNSDLLINQAIELEEEVNAKLELVNTANQRRNNLIPELLNAATNSSTKDLNKEINSLQEEIQNSEGENRIELEKELESKINQVKGIIGTNNVKSGLIIEMEGAENRISFARNAYNETVKQYNVLIKKNKDDLSDYDLKPYYK